MAGGAMGGGDEDDDIISGINVTPLVDVVLVLLIILMVTATAIVSKTILMELPSAATADATENTPTTLGISIDAEGALYLDRDPVSEDELRSRVRAREKLRTTSERSSPRRARFSTPRSSRSSICCAKSA
ncbi:MAG: biopolymer transporter ExbD [Sandaracinus sp.]|nr:biopolymer transporter ExbD [Sandaracinus sp.]